MFGLAGFCKAADHNSTHSCTFLFPLFTLIFNLLYACGNHPGMAWWANSFSLNAHICHITSTVSHFSLHFVIDQLPPSPRTDCSIFRTVELNIPDMYKYIYIYIRTLISCTVSVSVYTAVNEPIQQHTAVRYDELRLFSISIKLPHILTLHLAKTKCGLSPAAAVCVHWVECAEGVGRIDNSAVGAGLSYLMNRVKARNVWNAYWRSNVANTSSLRLFFLGSLEFFIYIILPAALWLWEFLEFLCPFSLYMYKYTCHFVLG